MESLKRFVRCRRAISSGCVGVFALRGSAAQFKLAEKRPVESLAGFEWLQNIHLICVSQHALLLASNVASVFF